MNKELINKYKPEFDHWLNEGDILYKHTNSNAWWNEEPWSYSSSYVTAIIINDEYVELRKALAEGKTIEYLGQSSNLWHEVPEPDFNLHPTCYRIKPDEPKFKVGDFVRVVPKSNRAITNSGATEFTGIIRAIDKHNLYNIKGIDDTDWFESDDIQLWTPVKDEWCWFWDKCTPHRPTLRQYDIFPEEYGEENMFHDSEQNPFDFCEPFLNSLPSYLKDK